MLMDGVACLPRNANISRICVNSFINGDFAGEFYNPCLTDAAHFDGISEIIESLEQMMDSINYPQKYMQCRTFSSIPKLTRRFEKGDLHNMECKEFETKFGEKATFIIKVQFRQNASWQGTITWAEKNKVQNFRSALEMIKLMDDAVENEDKEDIQPTRWS